MNSIQISGNIAGDITFQETRVKKTPACSFSIISTRDGVGDTLLSTKVKINVYGEGMCNFCKDLKRGEYIEIEGELMNRKGNHGLLTEVRAINLSHSFEK